MAFKLATPASKRRKLQPDTKLQAFAADDGEEDATLPSASHRSSDTATTPSTGTAAAAGASALKERGSTYAEGGDYAAALRCWEQALVLAPHDAALHEMRSQVLNEVGDAWGSVQAAARAVDCSPQWADAHLTLARARHNLGEPALALQSFDAALALMGQQAASAPELQEELQQLRMLALAQQRHARAAGASGSGRAAVVAPEVASDSAPAADVAGNTDINQPGDAGTAAGAGAGAEVQAVGIDGVSDSGGGEQLQQHQQSGRGCAAGIVADGHASEADGPSAALCNGNKQQ